jgi:GGDEF domain-containing protein
VVAPETGRDDAEALAARIAAAVAGAGPWRGAPLGATVGVAVFGENGRDPAGLIEAAEEARFAASASGVPVIERGSL